MTADEQARPLPAQARHLIQRIEAARRPLLVSHIRLDGDALGSELGLFHILKQRGAAPHVVNDGAIPRIYRFLPGADEVGLSPAALTGAYDLAVLLDTGEWARAGGVRPALPPDLRWICIDHHPPVAPLAEWQWVQPATCAVGEMVYDMACAAGWTITPEAATCLYTAIMTDTGRFTFPNTTPSALRAAARLMELGAQVVRAADCVYEDTPRGLVLLRGEVTRSARFHADGRIAVMSATLEMFERFAVEPMDTQEMADYPRAIEGVRIGVLLREMKGGKVKVSLRSRAGVNVEPVARKFGGGGHPQAAGIEMKGSIAEVEKIIVNDLLPLAAQGASHEQR